MFSSTKSHAHVLQRQNPPPSSSPSSSHLEPETSPAVELQLQHDLVQSEVSQAVPPPPDAPQDDAAPEQDPVAQHQFQDWTVPVVTFCLTAAVEIAILSIQNRTHYPLTFHLMCLFMVFAFACIFVARYIGLKHPNQARLLEHVGLLCGVTAFFMAITVSFPLLLKVISWVIYALSLLVISVCN